MVWKIFRFGCVGRARARSRCDRALTSCTCHTFFFISDKNTFISLYPPPPLPPAARRFRFWFFSWWLREPHVIQHSTVDWKKHSLHSLGFPARIHEAFSQRPKIDEWWCPWWWWWCWCKINEFRFLLCRWCTTCTSQYNIVQVEWKFMQLILHANDDDDDYDGGGGGGGGDYDAGNRLYTFMG